jgi:hypothetical protein
MAGDPSLTGVIGVIVLFSCYFMPAVIALLHGSTEPAESHWSISSSAGQ